MSDPPPNSREFGPVGPRTLANVPCPSIISEADSENQGKSLVAFLTQAILLHFQAFAEPGNYITTIVKTRAIRRFLAK
jgi:hypothetical protein